MISTPSHVSFPFLPRIKIWPKGASFSGSAAAVFPSGAFRDADMCVMLKLLSFTFFFGWLAGTRKEKCTEHAKTITTPKQANRSQSQKTWSKTTSSSSFWLPYDFWLYSNMRSKGTNCLKIANTIRNYEGGGGGCFLFLRQTRDYYNLVPSFFSFSFSHWKKILIELSVIFIRAKISPLNFLDFQRRTPHEIVLHSI